MRSAWDERVQNIDGQHDQDTPQAPCPSAGPILGDNLKESPELAGAEPENHKDVTSCEDEPPPETDQNQELSGTTQPNGPSTEQQESSNLEESIKLEEAEPEKLTGVINSEDEWEPIATKPQYLLDSPAENGSLNQSALRLYYRELEPAATANSEKYFEYSLKFFVDEAKQIAESFTALDSSPNLDTDEIIKRLEGAHFEFTTILIGPLLVFETWLKRERLIPQSLTATQRTLINHMYVIMSWFEKCGDYFNGIDKTKLVENYSYNKVGEQYTDGADFAFMEPYASLQRIRNAGRIVLKRIEYIKEAFEKNQFQRDHISKQSIEKANADSVSANPDMEKQKPSKLTKAYCMDAIREILRGSNSPMKKDAVVQALSNKVGKILDGKSNRNIGSYLNDLCKKEPEEFLRGRLNEKDKKFEVDPSGKHYLHNKKFGKSPPDQLTDSTENGSTQTPSP